MQMKPINSFLEINMKKKFRIAKSIDKISAQEKIFKMLKNLIYSSMQVTDYSPEQNLQVIFSNPVFL